MVWSLVILSCLGDQLLENCYDKVSQEEWVLEKPFLYEVLDRAYH